MAETTELENYKKHIRDRIAAVSPVFAKASVGDFSGDLSEILEPEDDLTELFVGTQLLLESIRETIADLEATVAALREANEKIATEEARVESILNSLGDGLLGVDKDCRINYVNRPAIEMLGDKALTLWQDISSVFLLEDEATGKILSGDQHPIVFSVRGGKQMTANLASKEKYYLHAGRDRVRIAFTVTPIKKGEETIGGTVIFRDITGESNLDRAKSELVEVASHQLRTPLSTVKWYADALISPVAQLTADRQLNYLKKIYQANERMIHLVNDLLAASNLEIGTVSLVPELIDVSKVLEDTLPDLAEQMIEKKLTIEKKIDPNLSTAVIDPTAMRTIMQNLLSNAVRYSLEGQQIQVELKNQDNSVLLMIRDGGIGIPKQFHNRVFTRLFRATNARSAAPDGSGLGLYITKAMVERSGGQVWFESDENQGATFYVTIPKGE